MDFEAIDGAEFAALEAALAAAEARPRAPPPFHDSRAHAPPQPQPQLLQQLARLPAKEGVMGPAPRLPAWLQPGGAPPPWPAPGAKQPLPLRHPPPPGQQPPPPPQAPPPPQPAGPQAHTWLSLLPSGRVAVHYTPQDCGPLYRLCASLPDAVQLPDGGPWTVPASGAASAARALATLPSPRVSVEPPCSIAAAALDFALKLPCDEEVEEAYGRVPPSLHAAMFPFQREGVRYVLRRGGRALIGDEMGLGKTVQAIALLAAYRDDWPALVLCPSSLRDTWAAALDTWLPPSMRPPGGPRVVLTGSGVGEACREAGACRGAHGGSGGGASGGGGDNQTHVRAPPGIVVLSYALLTKAAHVLGGARFGFVVADESHYLKDRKAQRTAAAAPLIRAARRAVCLTGTPALNRPVELFAQLSALCPAVFPSLKPFAERYCAGGFSGAFATGCSNPEELHGLLSCVAVVRRLKAEVLTQLPPKIRSRIVLNVRIGAELRRMRNELGGAEGGDSAVALGGGGGGSGSGASGGGGDGDGEQDGCNGGGGGGDGGQKALMLRLYAETGAAKADACADYMLSVLESSASPVKFLFFAHHTCVLDAVSARLAAARVGCMRIDGRTPVGERASRVASFQTDPAVRCAVLSIKAAGVGLTLTAASHVVFGELTWTPGEVVQAEDRAHRIGQRSSVNVHILHAPGTADDFLWKAIQHKLAALGQVLDGVGGDMAAPTRDVAPQQPGQRRIGGGSAAAGGGGGGGAAAPGTIASLFASARARAASTAGGGGGATDSAFQSTACDAPPQPAGAAAAAAAAAQEWNAAFDGGGDSDDDGGGGEWAEAAPLRDWPQQHPRLGGWGEGQHEQAAKRPRGEERTGRDDDNGWGDWE